MTPRRPGLARVALLVAGACASLSCFGGWAIGEYLRVQRRGEPASSTWVRIRHPIHPISFELPDNAGRERVYPSLGWLRTRDGSREEAWRYWVHALGNLDGPVAAVRVTFLWISPMHRGATAARLASLVERIHEPATAIGFLERVYFDPAPDPPVQDRGVALLDGRPARRLKGTERTPGSEAAVGDYVIFVVPVSTRAALIILGELHPRASVEERTTVLPRILHSLRFETAPPERGPPASGGARAPLPPGRPLSPR